MCADSAARVLVLTAMSEELGAFRGRRLPAGVVAAATGDGPRRAARAAAALLARHRPSYVIGAGVAGALTLDLGVGDIVVAHRIFDARGQAPASHDPLVARAAAKPGIRRGTLLSVDRPLVSASAKADWASRIGQPLAAVDMESASWARAAAAAGVPFVIVRAVSDGAEEELPGYLSECMDQDGGIRRAAVALRALARPATIPALLSMRRRVREASDRLAAFVAVLLEEGL